MENKVLAYSGAIIDGEGCICISKRSTNLQLVISMANTCKELTSFFLNEFGGTLIVGKTNQKNRLPFWEWKLNSHKEIIEFLEKIIPYLIIKREQAELGLKFAKQRLNTNKISNKKRGYTEEQVEIYNELKRLKKEHPTELPNYNFTEEEKLYYLAGFIDGDGCIRIAKSLHKNKYGNMNLDLKPLISVANTDKRASDFFVKEFGGFTHRKDRKEKNASYEWYMFGINKQEFFLKLKDKMIIKNDRLEILLKYIEIREKHRKRTEEEILLFLKLKELNFQDKKNYDVSELMKYNEIHRKPRKLFVEKEELSDLYLNQHLSIRQICEIYGVKFESVRNRLIKYGIKIRSSKEGATFHKPMFTEEGRKSLSEKASINKKELWKDPVYRKKMEDVLAKARETKQERLNLNTPIPLISNE